MRIKMLEAVMPCFFGNVLVEGAVYEATANRHGAISAVTDAGKVGVKPGEFEFLSAPKWVLDIWRQKYPAMCERAIIEDEKP